MSQSGNPVWVAAGIELQLLGNLGHYVPAGSSPPPFTNRQIDVSVPDQGYMGQVKTGKVSLTEQAKIDIQTDAYLVKVEGKKVEYLLEKGASKPFLDVLE